MKRQIQPTFWLLDGIGIRSSNAMNTRQISSPSTFNPPPHTHPVNGMTINRLL